MKLSKPTKPIIIYVDGGFDTTKISDALYKYLKAINLTPIRFETDLQYKFNKKMNSIGIKHDLNWYFFHRESNSLNVDKNVRINNLFNYISLQELDISKSIYDLMSNTDLIDVFIVKDNSVEKLFEGLIKIYLELEDKPSKIIEDIQDILKKYRRHLLDTGVFEPDIIVSMQKPSIDKYFDMKTHYFDELFFLDTESYIETLSSFFMKDNIIEMGNCIVEKDNLLTSIFTEIKHTKSIDIVYPRSSKLYLEDLNNFINKFKNILIKKGILNND